MLTDEKADELLAPVYAAMREALCAAYGLGDQDGAGRLLEVLRDSAARLYPDSTPKGVVTMTPEPVPAHQTREPPIVTSVGMVELPENAKRAPKGLVDDVLLQVLAERPGMTQEEVEDAVVAVDDRIAKKSVYNKLRWWEKQGQRFGRLSGRWYRLEDLPAPFSIKSSPQGETGGVEPPGFDLTA